MITYSKYLTYSQAIYLLYEFQVPFRTDGDRIEVLYPGFSKILNEPVWLPCPHTYQEIYTLKPDIIDTSN